MSQFECPVVRVTIEPHPNADAIELARVGGYLSIVKKGQFRDGDLAVYIPEQSVLPEWLLRDLGFWDDMNAKGKLSGGAGNRVRAIKLRGTLSQGVLLAGNCGDEPNPDIVLVDAQAGQAIASRSFNEGQDAAEWLGIAKYEPVVPQSMAGRVAGGDLDATIGYDFENLKKIPTLFDGLQDVVITEKLHGTCLQVGLIPRVIWEGKSWAGKCPDFGDYKGIVTSKGQGAKGLMLDPSDEGNLYVKTVRDLGLWDKLHAAALETFPDDMPVFLFGEIFGAGVQDLTYGFGTPTFRAFDLHVGSRSTGYFEHYNVFCAVCAEQGIPVVPHLYRGPFSADKVAELTDGRTTFDANQIREGVVIRDARSSVERHPRYGRYIAKSVSAAYLTRKGEVTEFQ